MNAKLDFATLTRWLASGALLGTSDGCALVGLGESDRASSSAFYAPDFFLAHRSPWRYYEEYRWIAIADLLRSLESMPSQHNDDWLWTPPSAPRFETAFRDLQSEFQSKRLEKGVPFSFERAFVPASARGLSMNAARIVSSLRSVLKYACDRPVMPYGFWSNTAATSVGMLGCTPEILFQQNDTDVSTVAVAGTRLVGDHGRVPLMEDVKERREHQIVIDAIVSSLGGFGDLEVHSTGVVHFPHLSHLKTPIDVKLHDRTGFEDLVKALHPTPALGAYPKQHGWNWLKRMEASNGVDRLRFGAPFGARWGDGLQGFSIVAIRNMQWSGSDVMVCAGCGVNELAKFENEWAEIQGKIRATKSLLGLGGETRPTPVPRHAIPLPLPQMSHAA